MVPKSLDSGETERRGHITRQGSRLVRSLLVEVAWAGLRHNAWVRQTYQRLSGGKKARKKIAIVAVGRKLLVKCWAMLRDNRAWDWQPQITRSEEHTSELQSQSNLVCRLLLEKKNKIITTIISTIKSITIIDTQKNR